MASITIHHRATWVMHLGAKAILSRAGGECHLSYRHDPERGDTFTTGVVVFPGLSDDAADALVEAITDDQLREEGARVQALQRALSRCGTYAVAS